MVGDWHFTKMIDYKLSKKPILLPTAVSTTSWKNILILILSSHMLEGQLEGFPVPHAGRGVPRIQPGETDSEQAFCHILDILSERETTTWTEPDFEVIEGTLREINDGKNTLNCIFSDGSHFFCYSDENDHNNGLRYTKQFAPFGSVELVTYEDRLGSVELRSEIPSALDQSGYLISTRILTTGEWTEFSEGELIVFKDGQIVYPKSRF